MQNLPAEIFKQKDQQKSDIGLNAGLVAMNLFAWLLTDQGIGSNIIFWGFDKSKINEVLRLMSVSVRNSLITAGYTDDKLEPSYRLPLTKSLKNVDTASWINRIRDLGNTQDLQSWKTR